MASSFDIFYMIVISSESVIGILAGAFIVTVNLLDWAKHRRLNTCDRIALALGISGTCSHCTLMGDAFVSKILRLTFINDCLVPIQLKMWAAVANFWLTTCLCVFYCVKSVDFNHHSFIWLKLRISKVVPWMIVGSVVGSLVLSIPAYWSSYRDSPLNSTTHLIANATVSGGEQKWRLPYVLVVSSFGYLLPLLLDMTSITLILTSRCKHARWMKENASRFSRPRLEAHYGAAKMVGTLLLIYTFMLLAESIRLCIHYGLLFQVLWMIVSSVVLAQSITLIVGITKLRQRLQKAIFH